MKQEGINKGEKEISGSTKTNHSVFKWELGVKTVNGFTWMRKAG